MITFLLLIGSATRAIGYEKIYDNFDRPIVSYFT